MDVVISKSQEENVQTFKDKMESFLDSGKFKELIIFTFIGKVDVFMNWKRCKLDINNNIKSLPI